MSAAGWFIVLLALVGANLPFLNQRLFAAVPLKAAKKSAWIRIAELIVLYFVVGALGFMLEARAGNRFEQGWQFYAITFACSWCSRSPASPSSISSNVADGVSPSRTNAVLRSQMAEFPDHDAALTETCLESKTIHQGPFLTLKCDTVRLPDGKQATREYVNIRVP